MALTKIPSNLITLDAIDGTLIADDAINSEHIANGAIDAAHMSANSIDSDSYVDGSIDNAHLADDAVGVAELSATGTASSSTFLRGDNAWTAVTPAAIATYTNSTNNRILTSVDSSTVNSEANLTFDGSTLAVTGAVNSTGEMRITNPSATSQLYLYGASGQKSNIILNEYGVRAWYIGAGTFTSGELSISDGTTERLGVTTAGVDVTGTLAVSGTATVGGTLGVTGTTTITADTSHLRLAGATTATKGLALLFDNSNNRSEIRSDQAGVNQLDLMYYALDHHFGRNASNITMTLTDDNKVGIGTTSPTLGKLEVQDGTGGADKTVAHFGAHIYGEPSYTTYINLGTEYGDGTSRIGSINTTGNQSSLVFETHAAGSGSFTERMRIDNTGKVGIGDSNPQHPFKVHLTNGQLAMFGSNGMNSPGQYAGIGLGQVLANNTTYQKVAIVAEGRNSGNYVSNLHFLVDTAADSGSAVLADSKMMISGGTGYVGIGTTSPLTALEVHGTSTNAYGTPQLAITGRDNANHYFNIGFGYTNGTTKTPAEIGFYEGTSSGNTKGSLVFATRNVTTDTIPTERMRIDETGKVGIGNSTPGTLLTVGNTSGSSELAIVAGTSSAAYLYFGDGYTGSDRYRGYIGYYHNGDYMTLNTSTTPRLRVDGDGIKFHGDTAAANALDDYEEGTWTPAFYTYSGVTTSSITTYGIYTKIGRIVHIHAKITCTLSSLPGQTVTITGLPFAATNTSDTGQRSIIAIGGDNSNTGANTPKAHFRTDGSQLHGVYYNASNNTAYWAYAHMDSSTFEMHIHGHYTT